MRIGHGYAYNGRLGTIVTRPNVTLQSGDPGAWSLGILKQHEIYGLLTIAARASYVLLPALYHTLPTFSPFCRPFRASVARALS